MVYLSLRPFGVFGKPLSRRKLSTTAHKRLKILYFGTDTFSMQPLKLLHKESLKKEVVGELSVCCIPMKSLESHVHKYSRQNDLNIYYYPPDIESGQFDIGVLASFGKMLPKDLIEKFPLGVLNAHASLLPRWRGATPITHSLMHGEKETGISIMEIKPHRFDVGGVLAQESSPIHPDQTRPQLTEQLSYQAASLMLKVLNDLEHYRNNQVVQEEAYVTYAPLLSDSYYNLDFTAQTASQIYDLYRAIGDTGKFRTIWEETGARVRLSSMVHPSKVQCLEEKGTHLPENALPGRCICFKTYNGPSDEKKVEYYMCIKAREGWVAFEEVNVDNKKAISALDFWNGYFSKNCDREEKYFVAKTSSES